MVATFSGEIKIDDKKEIPKYPKNIKDINDYKILKLEFFTYMEGYSKGNPNLMSKIRIFFRNLESLVFNEDIDINEMGFL